MTTFRQELHDAAEIWHMACEAQKAAAATLLVLLGRMDLAPKVLTMKDASFQPTETWTLTEKDK